MKRFFKKKVFIWIAIILIILGITGGKIYGKLKGLQVNKYNLESELYEKQYVEEGSVSSKNMMKVYSPFSGTIADVLKSEGEEVQKGDVILKIDSEDLFYSLEILKARKQSLIGQKNSEIQINKSSDLKSQKEMIKIAEDKKINLEKDLSAKEKLYESGAISSDELRNSQMAYDNAVRELSIQNYKYNTLSQSFKLASGKAQFYESEIKAIDIEIEKLEGKVEDSDVKALADGVISYLDFDKGDYILENQLIFEIFDPDYYEIESYVLAKESKNLTEGMEAYLEIDENSLVTTVRCQIKSISKSAKEIVSNLGLKEKKVKVVVSPVEKVKLIQGENVDVKFVTYKKENAQVVSKDYVFPWNDGEGIWIIENGKSKIINIEKDFETSSFIVLKENFPQGTEIIIPEYPEKLEEGIKVY